MTQLNIKQGPTFAGWISWMGMLVLVTGIWWFISSQEFSEKVVSILLILSGLQMFIHIKGVVINQKKLKLKTYSFIFFPIGKWIDISDFSDITSRNTDSTETGGIRSAFITVHSKYTDLYLINKQTGQKILLKSCRNVEEANKLKEQLLFMKKP